MLRHCWTYYTCEQQLRYTTQPSFYQANVSTLLIPILLVINSLTSSITSAITTTTDPRHVCTSSVISSPGCGHASTKNTLCDFLNTERSLYTAFIVRCASECGSRPTPRDTRYKSGLLHVQRSSMKVLPLPHQHLVQIHRRAGHMRSAMENPHGT